MTKEYKNINKKNVATDSMKLSIAQIFSLIINMINIMLLSRYRSVEEYGTYSQMLMVSSIAVTFLASGFSQCINYFLANEENLGKRAKFIKTYYCIVSIAAMLSGVLSFSLIPFLEKYFDNPGIGKYWFFLLIYPFANVLNNGADRFFILYHKANQLMLFKLRYGFTTLMTVMLAIVFNWTFTLYLQVFIVVELSFALLIYYFIYKVTGVIPFGCSCKLIKKILTFAIPMGLAGLVATINSELDKFVIGGLTDTETLAIYTNAAKELPIYVFSSSISTVVMPYIVQKIQKGDNRGAADIWNNSIKLSTYIIVFFVIAFYVFAPQVISVLYSDKYISGVGVFRVYLFALIFRLTYYGMILNAQKKTKLILICSIMTMLSNLILDIIFFYFIGVTGPAWATVLSVGVMNILQLVFTTRTIQVHFLDIYPVFHIIRVIIINIILGIVFYFIQQKLFIICNLNQNILTVCLGIIWGIVYFLIIKNKIFKLWKYLNS